MHKSSLIPVQMLPDVLWLEFNLTRRLDNAGVEDWQIRCMLCLTRLRLRAVVSTSLIVAMGDGRLITADERNEVILWLLTQPEVLTREIRVGALLGSSAGAGNLSRG